MIALTTQGPTNIGKRVLFLGDSITDQGMFISFLQAYFQLSEISIELINAGVSSETVSGLSEKDHPYIRPCVFQRLATALDLTKPDWTVVCYGMNDGIYQPLHPQSFLAFQEGIRKLTDEIHQAGSQVILLTPFPYASSYTPLEDEADYSYKHPFPHYDEVLKRYANWIMEDMKDVADVVLDLHQTLKQYLQQRSMESNYQWGDGIHPGWDGHLQAALFLLHELFHHKAKLFEQRMIQDQFHYVELEHELMMLNHLEWKEKIGHGNPNKAQRLSKKQLNQEISILKRKCQLHRQTHPQLYYSLTTWHTFKRIDFLFEGYEAILVVPDEMNFNCPWIWRTEFFDAFSEADVAMVQQGFALAYVCGSDLYGCDAILQMYHRFQLYLIQHYHLAKKAVLFGFSRGGFYALRYSATYPDWIGLLYLDAPVVDLASWPYNHGKNQNTKEWKDCQLAYHSQWTVNTLADFTESLLQSLVQVVVPLILVAGQVDSVVAWNENGLRLVHSWTGRNLTFQLILKEHGDHHPHSLRDPQPIVDFILSLISQ